MKYNIIFLVYVDDAILSGTDKQSIEAEIKSLGVSSDEHRHEFGLRDEGEVGNLLGIRIEKTGNNDYIWTRLDWFKKS